LLLEDAKQGNVEAQFNLGIAYSHQPSSYSEAIYWWCQATLQGHAKALFCLGEFYLYGRGVILNYEHALKCYQEAAALGNDDARHKLNENEEEIKRLIITREYQKAVLWSKLANRKNLEAQYEQSKTVKAQYELALMFERGEGVYKNSDRALELWCEAAKQEHSESKYRLWHKEAERGNIKAQYRLGNAYFKGEGNKKTDETKAIEWWQKAAEQGHLTAQYNLGVVYRKAKEHQNALQYFDTVVKHTDKGNALVISAQYLLGIMYKNGEGCSSPNYQKARECLKRATGFEKGIFVKCH
jgi:hypothetical protein